MLLFGVQEVVFAVSSLQKLAGLTKLQSLVIVGYYAHWQLPEDDAAPKLLAQQFPRRLTSLTKLDLHRKVLPTISSVSACVSLQDLYLWCLEGGRPALGVEDWEPLARLAGLTKLCVDVEVDIVGVEPFYTVIERLKELHVVGVSLWYPSALPQLQSLTHLTAECVLCLGSLQEMGYWTGSLSTHHRAWRDRR